MKHIPFALIYSRIFLAIAIAILAFGKLANYQSWIVALLIIGLLTDVFDGIIARKLNVSSEKLRIWDSNVDQFFWLISIASIFYINIPFLKENILLISSIIFLELLAYIISFIKFKRTIATHSLLAKFWTLTLLAFLIDLCLHSSSSIIFYSCLILGLISRLEIILIILKLKKWTNDVPSIFAVNRINKGLPIKKNKLFNS